MLSDKDIEREQARAEEALERRDQKMEERCGNCLYWKRLDLDEVYPADDLDTEEPVIIGYCRRYPPIINPAIELEEFSHNSGAWTQPVTWYMDWCGEWQSARELEKQPENNPNPTH